MRPTPDTPAAGGPGEEDGCGHACRAADSFGPSRRAFLREAGLAAAAALAAAAGLAGAARAAGAAPLAFTTPARSAGSEHTYPVPATDGAAIDTVNEVIVVRWQGAVYAFNLACPHQHVALRWLDGPPGEARFQCPKHKSKYRPDGSFIEGRATRPMDRLGVRRDGAGVAVDTSRLLKQPDDPAAYAAAVVRLA